MRFNPKGEDDERQFIDEYLDETGHTKEVEVYKNSTYGWNPADHDGRVLRITKSNFGTFNWCPQQYYLQSFKGLRGETVYYHTRGLNVHDMVEYFWATFTSKEDALALIAMNDDEGARQLLHATIPSPPTPYLYGEDEQIAQWVDWQFQRLKITQGINWEPTKVEANIHANRFVEVDDVQIPIHLSGYIDTIFDTGKGGYALMELKTGKYNSSKPTNMRKEMAFYKMMLDHSPHAEYLPITHWGWEFPGGGIEGGVGPTIDYEKVGKRAMTSVENGLKKLIRAHINMEFPPTPFLGKLPKGVAIEDAVLKCNWCDYKSQCEFWSVTDDYLDDIMEGK